MHGNGDEENIEDDGKINQRAERGGAGNEQEHGGEELPEADKIPNEACRAAPVFPSNPPFETQLYDNKKFVEKQIPIRSFSVKLVVAPLVTLKLNLCKKTKPDQPQAGEIWLTEMERLTGKNSVRVPFREQ